jgi:hypothetical protein
MFEYIYCNTNGVFHCNGNNPYPNNFAGIYDNQPMSVDPSLEKEYAKIIQISFRHRRQH